MEWIKAIITFLRSAFRDREFKMTTYPVTESGLFINSDCCAIEFYCDVNSTNDARVNGRPLPKGSSWGPPSNKNEKDISKYLLTFTAVAAGNLVYITRKEYQKPPFE